ncbi:MAG: threonylcarbamoyl-AMP synthase [Candidatus Improbicoccus pseudotrichonymphae]|uniref:Threonylcarbamoyl-AMP synthase n=1 Tax=Candidatus Improbicoccus pseudotrichonymphae TaxID=3033792 RepID=A0AA48I8F4_9FIRM|nr:MAG: threonylcarbamoyl-AMP synthase [Candidatus Improbicoccus pseudotrichonymphae]
MKTLILSDKKIDVAAEILKEGGIVAIPTETVYGLAADAFNKDAVKKIFKSKNRPNDNPIIVHISKYKDLEKIVSNVPEKTSKLIEKFWPGPLTIIFKKTDLISNVVSGGLDTVAVRMPSLKITRQIIDKSSILAAPSANISGKPSAVNVKQVLEDLDGTIDAVVDIPNFSCNIGIESTVIDINDENTTPVLLRPGAVTRAQIESIIGKIDIDPRIIKNVDSQHSVVSSPGLKYKHYAPDTELIISESERSDYIKFVNSLDRNKNSALCFDEDLRHINIPCVSYGPENDINIQSFRLYTAFREIDDLKTKTCYIRINKFKKNNDGLGIYNRILRAASFKFS